MGQSNGVDGASVKSYFIQFNRDYETSCKFLRSLSVSVFCHFSTKLHPPCYLLTFGCSVILLKVHKVRVSI